MARRKLTQQQQARIAKIQAAHRQSANSQANQAINQQTGRFVGRVLVRHGQNLLVRDSQGKRVHCLFRQNLGEVVCGDQVVWQANGENGVVVALKERSSTLSRPGSSGQDKPIAANISQLIVVLAPEPAPTGYLLDQYLIAAKRIGVDALICLNKADLLDPTESELFRQNFAHYEGLGYPVIQTSAKTPIGRQPLLERLNNNTSILVGQSGVGKSSLTNSLIANLAIEEGKLSKATGLGKHTTSTATLYRLPSGGELIDSPGVRSFRLDALDRETLQQGYPEIHALLGQCRFHNCLHQTEPDCAVQKAVQAGTIHPDRLASFQHLRRGIKL